MVLVDAPCAPLSNGLFFVKIWRVEDSVGETLLSTLHAGGTIVGCLTLAVRRTRQFCPCKHQILVHDGEMKAIRRSLMVRMDAQ